VTQSLTLAPESIDAIARRVVELLRVDAAAGLIDAVEVAQLLGVSRSYVYDHLGELGAIRVGGRWRFDRATVEAARAPAEQPPAPTEIRRHTARRVPARGQLLPIRGAAA